MEYKEKMLKLRKLLSQHGGLQTTSQIAAHLKALFPVIHIGELRFERPGYTNLRLYFWLKNGAYFYMHHVGNPRHLSLSVCSVVDDWKYLLYAAEPERIKVSECLAFEKGAATLALSAAVGSTPDQILNAMYGFDGASSFYASLPVEIKKNPDVITVTLDAIYGDCVFLCEEEKQYVRWSKKETVNQSLIRSAEQRFLEELPIRASQIGLNEIISAQELERKGYEMLWQMGHNERIEQLVAAYEKDQQLVASQQALQASLHVGMTVIPDLKDDLNEDRTSLKEKEAAQDHYRLEIARLQSQTYPRWQCIFLPRAVKAQKEQAQTALGYWEKELTSCEQEIATLTEKIRARKSELQDQRDQKINLDLCTPYQICNAETLKDAVQAAEKRLRDRREIYEFCSSMMRKTVPIQFELSA